MEKVRIFEKINGNILSLNNSHGVHLRIGTVCSQGIIKSFNEQLDFSRNSFIMATLEPTHTDGRPIACLSFHVDALRRFDENYNVKRRRLLLLLK
jgi:hypothetical protein